MDGNFVDNDFDSIIESASIQPQAFKEDSSKTGTVNRLNKYDKFTLKIKFSRDLNPSTVNGDNAELMAGNVKIGATVAYDEKKRTIVIKPKSNYKKNKLYIVKISGKIMTAKGRSLRKYRFFAFKHNGSNLNFYRGISGEPGVAPKRLPIKRDYLLPFLFFTSAVILVGSYLYDSEFGLITGTIAVLITVVAAIADGVSDYGKSHKEYVFGAKLYNQGYFYESLECFERALHHNPSNQYAKYALDAAIIKNSKVEDYDG